MDLLGTWGSMRTQHLVGCCWALTRSTREKESPGNLKDRNGPGETEPACHGAFRQVRRRVRVPLFPPRNSQGRGTISDRTADHVGSRMRVGSDIGWDNVEARAMRVGDPYDRRSVECRAVTIQWRTVHV